MSITNKDNSYTNLNKEIFLAVLEDINQIDSISQEIWGETGKYSNNFYTSIINQNLSYVYKEKNILIAFCLVRYDSKSNQVGISLLCVKKNYQRKGIGKTLLQYCINNCRKKGHENFYLHVAAANKAAINLYLKFGFKGVKHLPNYYSKEKWPYNEAFLMKLETENKILDIKSEKVN